MNHLLEATEVHTLFVDRDLRLRKFTPKIGEAFHLLPQDVGRRLDSFAHDIEDDHLLDDLERVLVSGVTRRARGDATARATPTSCGSCPTERRGRVDGVVLTLVDMSALKRAQRELAASEERYRTLVRAITAVMWTADADGARSPRRRPSGRTTRGTDWQSHRGDGWLAAIHADDRERVRRRLEARLWPSSGRWRREGRIWSQARRDYRYFVARAAPLLDDAGDGAGVGGAHRRRPRVEDRRDGAAPARRADPGDPRPLADLHLRQGSVRPLPAGRTPVRGGAGGAVRGDRWARPTTSCCRCRWPTPRRSSERQGDGGRATPSRSRRWCSAASEPRTFLTSLFPLRDGHGGTYAFAGVSTDITERKRAAEEAQAGSRAPGSIPGNAVARAAHPAGSDRQRHRGPAQARTGAFVLGRGQRDPAAGAPHGAG